MVYGGWSMKYGVWCVLLVRERNTYPIPLHESTSLLDALTLNVPKRLVVI